MPYYGVPYVYGRPLPSIHKRRDCTFLAKAERVNVYASPSTRRRCRYCWTDPVDAEWARAEEASKRTALALHAELARPNDTSKRSDEVTP